MNIACRICGSQRTAHWFDSPDHVTGEVFGLRRCEDCGFGFTWPQPRSLDRYYADFYRDYDRASAGLLQRLQQRRARRWVRALGHTGRCLDIGCGDGWILAEIRRQGWRVIGLERTVQSARFAREVQNLPIIVGPLEAMRDDARFDLIVLHQALEHLPDPMHTLQHCCRLLRPGGRLVVAVPNLDSWQARWARGHWLHLDVPRHLAHFTPTSLRRALERAGLVWESARYVSWEYDPVGWVDSALNKLGFPMNALLRIIQHDPRLRPGSVVGVAALMLAAVLILPATLLAILSWATRRGAIMEVQAYRPR
ncbi:MAG: class I SAM-dependent methyltransferase [Verrucomicrobiae bacterium]|nr:class I SAM-dependent methyltransferase [Verrucomicrobiae bacterium]